MDLSHLTLTERVDLGERVKAIVDTQGFRDLCQVIELHGEGLLRHVVYAKPRADASEYADAIGHLRGLGELAPIARGIVEDGKLAGAELRAEQEGQ